MEAFVVQLATFGHAFVLYRLYSNKTWKKIRNNFNFQIYLGKVEMSVKLSEIKTTICGCNPDISTSGEGICLTNTSNFPKISGSVWK